MKIGAGIPNAQNQSMKNEKVYEAAQMYEQQFLRDMVRAMRSTVVESELVPTSMGEKIFREKLDDQYVEKWSEKGGVGFADMIYDHIMDKYYNSRMPIQRPKGPVPIEGKNIEIKPLNDQSTFKIRSGEPLAVMSPWSGELKQFQDGDRIFAVLKHDNGLESRIGYIGSPTKVQGRVESGQRIGQSDGPELLWHVKSTT